MCQGFEEHTIFIFRKELPIGGECNTNADDEKNVHNLGKKI
jgi:hypothetical protein